MIELRGASADLGGTRVVDGVDLQVERGGWTMVIGPNGAGKTTLLRAVAGLTPSRGTIRVAGRDVGAMDTRERARTLALVPQSPLLPADMTVGEYVLLGRTAHLGFLGRPGDADRRAAAESMARLDLARFAGRRLAALSGGERQRAVLARALAQDAPVLLLDEPTSALDVGRQQEVLDLVARLRAERELTVLGAIHDLTLAGHYADRLVLMAGGRVVAAGPPAEVLLAPLISEHYRARVRIEHVAGMPVVVPSPPPPGGPS